MEDIFKIIFGVTASISITGGVILFIIKLAAEKIADALEKKYTIKFDKEIEKYKSLLEGKNYITQKQYDVEFSIYRALSKDFFSLLLSMDTMYSSDYDTEEYHVKDDNDAILKFFILAGEKICSAQDNLQENRAFVDKKLFEKYDYILSEVLKMYWEYTEETKKKFPDETIRNKEWNALREEKVKNLQGKLEELNDELRDYLHSLKIID